jgi:hypothetical protein
MTTTLNSTNNTTGSVSTTNSLSILRSASGEWVHCDDQTDEFGIFNRAGTPEGAIAADTGSLCTDTTNADLYIKTTDTVNTGWSPFTLGGITDVVVQTFTANGTYTPTAGMFKCEVYLQGGGAGGGGVGATTGTQVAGAGGGGAGGYTYAIFDASTIGASQTVTIGAGGSGGAAGNNNGTSGGTSSFGALLTANGGAGGFGVAGGGTNGAIGGGGGSASGGIINIDGSPGYKGLSFYISGATESGSGQGANSMFGFGGRAIRNIAGDSGKGFGSGGSGAANQPSEAAKAGGSGRGGICVIREYIRA